MKFKYYYIKDLAYWSLNNVVNDLDEIFNHDSSVDKYLSQIETVDLVDYKKLSETIKIVKDKMNDQNVITFIEKYKEMNDLIKTIILNNYFNKVDLISTKEDDAQGISNLIAEKYIDKSLKKVKKVID